MQLPIFFFFFLKNNLYKNYKKNQFINSYYLKNSNNTKKQLPKLKCTTVNLAVDVSDTMKKCTISNGLILLKLKKKKLSFRGNAYFKAVS